MRTVGKNQHVVPHDGDWAIRGEGNERLTGIFPTQGDAVERGREIAIQQNSELIVLGRDGQIRWRNSYGHDPYPPRG